MPRITRQLLNLMVLAALMLTSFTSRPALAAPEQCFNETGFCIVGRFYQYW